MLAKQGRLLMLFQVLLLLSGKLNSSRIKLCKNVWLRLVSPNEVAQYNCSLHPSSDVGKIVPFNDPGLPLRVARKNRCFFLLLSEWLVLFSMFVMSLWILFIFLLPKDLHTASIALNCLSIHAENIFTRFFPSTFIICCRFFGSVSLWRNSLSAAALKSLLKVQ
jgi:hypothetical protein